MKEFNKMKRGELFDTHLSYRICSQLRDYAQHRALPLGGFSVGGDSDIDLDDAGNLRKTGNAYSISPWLDAVKFRVSSQCKAELRIELEDLGYEAIDLKWLIRSFASAMSKRHAALREHLTPSITAAGEAIVAGYDLASTSKGSATEFLELCWKDKKRPMKKELGELTLASFKKGSSLMGAEIAYVTSKITQKSSVYSGQDSA